MRAPNAEAFMSQLNRYFTLTKVFRNTNAGSIALYRHKEEDHPLLVISSKNNNDSVFEKLLQIESPYLPKIYEVLSTPGSLYILEEYIEGESFARFLEKNGKLPAKTAYRLMYELCEAVHVLHQLGIVHRDIKPENILLSNGRLKLIDFGIAHLMSEDAKHDTIALGTAGYAAPEQFGISRTTVTADVYALGVIFNEMLTNEHPSVKLAPGAAGRIIRKCLSTQASTRYHDAGVLKKRIKRLMRFGL